MDLERIFILFYFVFEKGICIDMSIVDYSIVELARIDISLDSIDEVDHFHIGSLTSLGHCIADIDDLYFTFTEGFFHACAEQVGNYTRIEIARPDDDVVSIQDGFSGIGIDITLRPYEPGIGDILIDIMSPFSWIFIGDIDIFLSYDLSAIVESDSQIDILECHRDDTTPYIEHLCHHKYSLLEVSITDICESGEEDIPDFVAADDSFLIFEAVFEQFSNHICIFRECSDRSSHISRREDPILITDSSCCSAIVCDGYDRRDIVVEIAFDPIEHIECPSTTSDGYDIWHNYLLIFKMKTIRL